MKALAGSSTATTRRASPDSSTASRPDRFGLTGPSRRPDPRVHAYRGDIADVALIGQVFASHYARPETCACAGEQAMVRAAPSGRAQGVSQLLHGEGFAVVELAAGWAWGRCLHDDYVGYVEAVALGPVGMPSHRVVVPTAPLFAAPDIKSAVVARWSLGARFSGRAEGAFVATDAGFLHQRHAAPLDRDEPDPVAVAERLIGQPYVWGGRGAGGIDCSGLVQLALAACGIAAPRDSDQQAAALGRDLAADEPLRRGDLVFLPGHVGWMADEATLLHANAHWMAVVAEPLADVFARSSAPIVSRRRIA